MRKIIDLAAVAGICVWTVFGAAQAEDETEPRGFVAANTIFTLHHEAAHMLISLLNLPVVGREEDAADQYAWLQMLETWNESGSAQPIRHAINGWRKEHLRTTGTEDAVPAWSEHSGDLQRHFMGICFAVGYAPTEFADLPLKYDMPEDRAEECAEETEIIEAAWANLLRGADQHGAAGLKVIYDAPPTGYAWVQDFVRKNVPFEAIVNRINQRYGFEESPNLRFADCGEADAYWDPEALELAICYREIAKYRNLVK